MKEVYSDKEPEDESESDSGTEGPVASATTQLENLGIAGTDTRVQVNTHSSRIYNKQRIVNLLYTALQPESYDAMEPPSH